MAVASSNRLTVPKIVSDFKCCNLRPSSIGVKMSKFSPWKIMSSISAKCC